MQFVRISTYCLAICLGLCLLLWLSPTKSTVANANPIVVAIESHETVTVSETGDVLVSQSLKFSRPLRELADITDRKETLWRTILDPSAIDLITTTFDGDTLNLQYKLTVEKMAPFYQVTLPPLHLAHLTETASLQYTLPLRINRQVDLHVPGMLVNFSYPISQQLGASSQLTLKPTLQTINHLVIKQSFTMNQPDLPALNTLRLGLPAVETSYLVVEPSSESSWPYQLSVGMIFLVSIAFVSTATGQKWNIVRLNSVLLNIFLALLGFLGGGIAIYLSLVQALPVLRPAAFAPIWWQISRYVLVSKTTWLLLLAVGCFLWYWAFSTLLRSVWTRWAGLCLVLILSIYVYGLGFFLLLLPELIELQRLILTVAIFGFSILIVPVLTTLAQPDAAYYADDKGK